MPDISILDEFTQIEADMATMEFAMERQQEAISAESRKLIVPYYQGIRDNHSGQIHYYEALMRLIGADGEVNSPMVFMAIAKKYRLYSTLSHMMIDRVLHDFADRYESVSINISAYDVNSKGFVNWFFGLLGEFPDPARITVVFVESEDFRES